MKKVYDTIGFAGVVLMFIAASLSDSGSVSFEKTLLLGFAAALLILISLNGVNAAEYTASEDNREISMTQNEHCVQKSA